MEDVSAAAFVTGGVIHQPWDKNMTLNVIMPAGFEAYVRMLHPVPTGGTSYVRWSDIASWNGVTLLADSTFEDIAAVPIGGRPQWGDFPSSSLARDVLAILSPILERHTDTPDDCWFGVWMGYGGVPYESLDYPRFEVPNRAYNLFNGAVSSVVNFYFGKEGERGRQFLPPAIWWPDDQAWCVASEIDHYDTFIGGTAACIDDILSELSFESFRAQITDRIGHGPRN